ncbi:hypothetical protein B0H17DRAFT_1149298 [Mycena rosella]|uniref:F-box domain-containing protein n=1 Tax=Mycena rosella TaxID=1033263 RepID=A0AAD7FTW9_MYCRO|nr:hypothetical protein B0H17DRAFT_1149298 [Mycena rosella]
MIVAHSAISPRQNFFPLALMNDLAQELADQIINWVAAEDSMHLCICNLVCKRWLHRTRYYLFSRVHLNTKSLRYFVDLVERSALPILCFIRHLELRYNDSPLDNTLLARAHLCPHLSRIEIIIAGPSTGWLRNEDLHSHLRSWSDASGSLSRLDLVVHRPTPNNVSLATLTNIVSCFPNLDTLGMRGIFLPEEEEMTNPLFTPSRLEHLFLSQAGAGGSVHLSWLRSFPVIPILKSLECAPPSINGLAWASIGAYFQHAGKGLLSLKVGRINAQTLKEQILQYAFNLENLRFRAENPAQLLKVLQSLRVSHAWIAIEVRVDGPRVGDDPIPWNVLDTLLAEPQFRKLRRFGILQFKADWTSIFSTQTMHLMPLANAPGILV